MSSRREVLIRILALLQRKTLIETKNRTLKWHYWTVRSIKNVALLTEDGAFALFFRPHPGGFASSRVPNPREFAIQGKKNANSRGSARGGPGRRWNWLVHYSILLVCFMILQNEISDFLSIWMLTKLKAELSQVFEEHFQHVFHLHSS